MLGRKPSEEEETMMMTRVKRASRSSFPVGQMLVENRGVVTTYAKMFNFSNHACCYRIKETDEATLRREIENEDYLIGATNER
jgi:hypothetical protein